MIRVIRVLMRLCCESLEADCSTSRARYVTMVAATVKISRLTLTLVVTGVHRRLENFLPAFIVNEPPLTLRYLQSNLLGVVPTLNQL
jgi:hypothetical protein